MNKRSCNSFYFIGMPLALNMENAFKVLQFIWMEKMKLNTLLTKTLFITMLLSNQAYSATLSFMGEGNYAKPNYSPNTAGTTTKSKAGYGGSVFAEEVFGSLLGIELGAIYHSRKYILSTALVDQAVTQNMLQVPLVLRVHLSEIFSIAGGVYYGFYLGNISYSNSAVGITYGYTNSYTLANLSKTDYGFVTSASINLPVTETMKIGIEARYNIGLKNNNIAPTTTQTMRFNELAGLLGLRFAI